MKNIALGLIIGSFFLLSSCKAVAKMHHSNIREVINSPDVTLVDVRVPEQYEEGTAKNAVNIPLAEIENYIDFFKEQKKVVIFCNKGAQADKAIEILKKNRVKNIHDGISWKNVKAIQNGNSPVKQ